MNEEYKQKIIELEEIHRPDGGISPEFSCHLCKSRINSPTCKGCPIYCQTFSND